MTPTEPLGNVAGSAERAPAGTAAHASPVHRLARLLTGEVDIAWLCAFRVLYGLALSVSMLRFLVYGWVERFFVAPAFHFKYWGFAWVQVLPEPYMHALFVLLALLGLAIAAGFCFRLSAVAFAVGLVYVQLIDVSTYLNHYYLAALLACLLACSPAHRAYSFDAWWRARRDRDGSVRPGVLRAWLWLFRCQVGLVYAFAALAKAQSDWLLHGQPLRIWLSARTDLPLLGPFLALPDAALVLSWCGFLFDASVVPLLSFRRTRPFAYAALLVFHTLTRVLFPIGMFPVIMTLSALFFFAPDWPRTLAARVSGFVLSLARTAAPGHPAPDGASAAAGSARGVASLPVPSRPTPRLVWLGIALGSAYCVLQLLLPLRFLAYGGNVLWHEQGMRFSWRVMLRAKGGNTTFVVRQLATGRVFHVSPRTYLTDLQEAEMSSQPDLIAQLARRIADDCRARGLGEVAVFADSRVALNGRRSRPFLDPTVDLARVEDGVARAAYVLPAPVERPPHTRPVL